MLLYSIRGHIKHHSKVILVFFIQHSSSILVRCFASLRKCFNDFTCNQRSFISGFIPYSQDKYLLLYLYQAYKAHWDNPGHKQNTTKSHCIRIVSTFRHTFNRLFSYFHKQGNDTQARKVRQ